MLGWVTCYIILHTFFMCMLHRYPGTTFMDHVTRYHDDPNVKMIVVLGEVHMLYERCSSVRILKATLKRGRFCFCSFFTVFLILVPNSSSLVILC